MKRVRCCRTDFLPLAVFSSTVKTLLVHRLVKRAGQRKRVFFSRTGSHELEYVYMRSSVCLGYPCHGVVCGVVSTVQTVQCTLFLPHLHDYSYSREEIIR